MRKYIIETQFTKRFIDFHLIKLLINCDNQVYTHRIKTWSIYYGNPLTFLFRLKKSITDINTYLDIQECDVKEVY